MIGAIILAGGSSRRFGDDKRKSVLPTGLLMLEESIHKAASVIDEVIVIGRHLCRNIECRNAGHGYIFVVAHAGSNFLGSACDFVV